MTPGRRLPSPGSVGRVLLGLALLLLLFVGYQLWGTGIVQSQKQESLRQQFERSLAAVPHRPGGAAVSGSTGSTGLSGSGGLSGPPATGQPVGTIDIPVIGLDQVVVEGVGASQLAVGPGHYPGTPLPGQAGNAAIAGHRTTHGRPFYDLNELGVGDRITVTTLQGVFHYRVSRSEIVAPDDVAVLDASTTPELTLTTCNPRYSAAQRLVVVARLVATGGPAPSTGSGPGATTGVLPGEAAADPLTDPADWLWLVLWSVALLAVVAAVLVVRHRPGRRWPLLVAAVPVGLVILFFWFGAVSTMLPATF